MVKMRAELASLSNGAVLFLNRAATSAGTKSYNKFELFPSVHQVDD